MDKVILCLTGLSAVGKSEVARTLSAEQNIPLFSLGDYQRERFGSPKNSADLREMYFARWNEFINQIGMRMSERGIIVDGIYSRGFYLEIQHRFQAASRLVSLTSLERDRARRLQIRAGISPEEAMIELVSRDKIKMQAGVEQVLRDVDATFANNNGELKATIYYLTEYLTGLLRS